MEYLDDPSLYYNYDPGMQWLQKVIDLGDQDAQELYDNIMSGNYY